MTQPAAQLFTVQMSHLASDGRKAAADLPPVRLYYLKANQVHAILAALEGIAATVAPPASPEVRITGPTGEFVVHVRGGQLHLVSWSSAHKGGPVTAARVVEIMTNQGEVRARGPAGRDAKAKSPMRERLTLIALGVAIVAVNCFTVLVLTRPPRTLLGEYRPLPKESAERLLSEVAGAYETGKRPGDRRLEIRNDASAQRVKFGPGGAVKDQQVFTVQPAESDGKRVLVTSRKSMITVKDSLSVVLYGDTYNRVPN